jgi:hypothetical protein
MGKLISTLAVGTSLLVVGLESTAAKAAKPNSDVSVTTSLADYNAVAQNYSLQSDTRGPYRNGVDGVVSFLLANGYNGQTWGDWRLDLTSNPTFRTVGISFCDPAHGTACALNAVQPGDPGYTAPATPPWWGTQSQPVRVQTTCSAWNRNMLTMRRGDAFTCSANVILPTVNNVFYELNMGTIPNPLIPKPETQQLQVTCTSSGTDGNCNAWFLDPIPIVNADGSVSPGQTRARLQQHVMSNGGKVISQTNKGDFYLTFHMAIARP